jgi:hypothetical protein
MSLHALSSKFELESSTALDQVIDIAKRTTLADVAARMRDKKDDDALAEGYNFEGLLDLYRLIQDASEALAKYIYVDYTSGHVTNNIVRSGLRAGDEYESSTGDKAVKGGSLGYKVRDTGKSIERSFDMSGFSPWITAKQFEENRANIEKIYQKLFSDVTLDDEWHRDPNETLVKGDASLQGKASYSLNEVIGMTANMNEDIRTMSGGVFKIKCRRSLIQRWGDKLWFDLTLSSHVPLLNHPDVRNKEVMSGKLPDNGIINVHIAEHVRIEFPIDAAMWMTDCEDRDDFSLLTFRNHLNPVEQRLLLDSSKFNNGKTDTSKMFPLPGDLSNKRYNSHMATPITQKLSETALNRIRRPSAFYKSSSPASTLRSLQDFRAEVGAVPPRMSEDGYSVQANGNVIYVNYKTDVDAYHEAETRAYLQDKGMFDMNAEVLENFRNKLLLIDWSGNIIAFTTDAGNINMVDLKGAQAVTDADIGDRLTSPQTRFIDGTQIEKDTGSYCRAAGIQYIPLPLRDLPGEKPYNFTFLDYHRDPGDGSDESEGGNPFWLTAALQQRGQMFRELWAKFETLPMALSKRMNYRFYFQMCGYYSLPENSKRYTNAWQEQVNTYNKRVTPSSDITVTNLDGLKAFYPHQRGIIGDVQEREPNNMLIGVSPGGGKSVMATSITTHYMQRKIIKRPLIVMPGQLKPNFAAEIYRFSKHRLRVFPLYREMWDRWNKDLDLGFAELQMLIESQPENTIFVSDYGFLKLRPLTVRVGHKSVYTYPFAVFMSRMFDMFTGDESHKIKNLSAQLSEAFATFAAYAKVKVLMSGTVLFNTGDDIIGQMNPFSPSAFGDNIDAYSAQQGVIDISKMSSFHARKNSFVKHYDANKRQWAFLLPRIYSNLHKAEMSPMMVDFYNNALEEVLGNIKEKAADIARREGIDVDDPSLDERMSAIAQVELSPLETFINAPDDEDNRYSKVWTKDIARGRQSLLVSPKVPVIDKIIDDHFAKNDSKILILSYNLAISKHIAKHSKHKQQMIHYTAVGAKESDLVKEFETNPNLKVMVADENTIKEGFNMQFCGRVIRAQTVWTVGEFEQSLSRVERPDEVMADGSLKNNRQAIYFDWVLITPSLEVAKTVRLYAKIIEKGKFDNYDRNKQFDAWISGQPVRGKTYKTSTPGGIPSLIEQTQTKVTFSPWFVQEYDTFDKLSLRDELYHHYMDWVYSEFDATKEDYRKEVAKAAGVDPETISDNKLRLMLLQPIGHDTMTGTETAVLGTGYLPFLPGVAPYDPYNLGLVQASRLNVSAIHDDNDDSAIDEDDSEEQVALEKGMIVFTEFGISEVTPAGKASARIMVGDKEIRLPRTQIWVPATRANQERLYRIYMQMKRKKLPTNTLEVDRGKLVISDIYVKEDELIGKTPSMRRPLLETKVDQAPPPPQTGALPPTARVQSPVTPHGNRPRNNLRIPQVMRPIVTDPKPVADVKPGRPLNPIRIPKFGSSKPNANAGNNAGNGNSTLVPVMRPRIPKLTPQQTSKPKVPVVPQLAQRKVVPKIPTELHLAHINNLLCIIAMADEADVLIEHGFHRIGASISCKVTSWRALDAMLTYLDQHFQVDQKSMDTLEANLKVFKTNEHNMERIVNKISAQRDFMLAQTRPVTSKSQHLIFPYLIVFEGVVHLMISATSQAGRKACMTLVHKKPVNGSGITRFDREEPFYLRFVTSMSNLDSVLEAIDPKIRIKNFDDLQKEYQAQLRGTKFHG